MDFGVGDLLVLGSSILVVCVVSFIHVIIIIGGSTIHASWDRSRWRMVYIYQVYYWWLLQGSNVTVSEFKYLYCVVWVGCEG